MKASELLFDDYRTLDGILAKTTIPKMFRVSEHFQSDVIENAYKETMRQLESSGISSTKILPDMRICITASSRGINCQKEILKAIVDFVKLKGAKPFVIPAMGSHGGATAEGQKAILEEYGITEEYLGCPIISSMETISLGYVEDEGKRLEVRVDAASASADGIIVFNRIKPHSAFRGPYESGLMKMMAIGMGKQYGAESLHNDGFGTFKRRIFLFGNFVRTHLNVLLGVSTVENAYDKCNRIDVIPSDEIPEREKELLSYAFTMMPHLPVKKADVLVVNQIGKDFSGSGMDPNITGTWATPYGGGGLEKQRVVVLDLSDASHGNALGMGNADIIPVRLFDKIDFMEMYPNVLTNTVFQTIKVPMVLKDDEMAIKAAIKTCNNIDFRNPRIVLIKNSLDLGCVYLSEAYWKEMNKRKDVEILSKPEYLNFKNGHLLF